MKNDAMELCLLFDALAELLLLALDALALSAAAALLGLAAFFGDAGLTGGRSSDDEASESVTSISRVTKKPCSSANVSVLSLVLRRLVERGRFTGLKCSSVGWSLGCARNEQ